MGAIFDQVRGAVSRDAFVFTDRADERLRERGITAWQVIDGLRAGDLVRERPTSVPFPIVEVRQMLADGTPVLAVWSWMPRAGLARLVTVHFFD
jgi:hypothetical protein